MKFLQPLCIYANNIKNIKRYSSPTLFNCTHTVVQYSDFIALIQHNNYTFSYLQLNSQLMKTPYKYNKSYQHFYKLILLNTKRGLKNKSTKLFYNALKYTQTYFLDADVLLSESNKQYGVFYNFAQTFPDEFFKPDFFIKYIYAYSELLFLIKKIKLKKKKKKTPQKTIVSYLSYKTRVSITLRVINAYINRYNVFSNHQRLSGALLYLILEGRDSFLYRKKMHMYNRLLEKKKFY